MSRLGRAAGRDGDRRGRLFLLDSDWDGDAASDGQSRFGAYPRRHRAVLADIAEDHRLDAVALIWRTTQLPVMTPSHICASPARC
jgi:hypothetical protein